MNEYNYEKNIDFDLDTLTFGSSKKVWWKCHLGHEWQASIKTRCKGSGCPYCSNHFLHIGYNDLETTNPELAKEWNYERNGSLKPENIKNNSKLKVWWKCEKGHEWITSVNYRSRTNNPCPKCKKSTKLQRQ